MQLKSFQKEIEKWRSPILKTVPAPLLSFSWTSAIEGSTWWWFITASNLKGEVKWCDNWIIKRDTLVAVRKTDACDYSIAKLASFLLSIWFEGFSVTRCNFNELHKDKRAVTSGHFIIVMSFKEKEIFKFHYFCIRIINWDFGLGISQPHSSNTTFLLQSTWPHGCVSLTVRRKNSLRWFVLSNLKEFTLQTSKNYSHDSWKSLNRTEMENKKTAADST